MSIESIEISAINCTCIGTRWWKAVPWGELCHSTLGWARQNVEGPRAGDLENCIKPLVMWVQLMESGGNFLNSLHTWKPGSACGHREVL